MLTNLVNKFASAIVPKQVPSAVTVNTQKSSNPFANPFMQGNTPSYESYGKNSPVRGGYFAGYYNGIPNIVGRRLFLEV